ncbi:MAG TPA: HAD family hydrolase [Symbiobacteriaceae bacterium]|nr:HAD family hydrolase [Symbiobacteriaceae bacterium]
MPRLRVGSQIVQCEGIVLDKDGTITDFERLWLAMNLKRIDLLQGWLQFGPHVRSALVKTMGLDPEKGRIDSRGPVALAPRLYNMTAFTTVLYQHGIHWDEAWARVQEAFAEADRTLDMDRALAPLPGVIERLKLLREAGFRLALATSDNRHTTDLVLKRLALDGWFEAIATGDRVTNPKPHPEMILQVASGMGLEPGRLIMVGDGITDVQMGRNAGTALSVGVLSGLAGADELGRYAHVIVESMLELEPA